MRVLSYDDLKAKGIRFSRQWIIKLIAVGKFPQSISLGEQSVGFIESEIDAWINDRIRERDQKRVAGTGSEIKRAAAHVGCNSSKTQRAHHRAETAREPATDAPATTPPSPSRRLGLADLKAAGAARRATADVLSSPRPSGKGGGR